MHVQKNELDFTNQNVYVGIDVHKKSWRVSILINDLFHKTFSQNPNPVILKNYLHKQFPGATYHTAYEAGFCGFWIHYAFSDYGIKSIVVNPSDIPTTNKELVQKEDSRDSLKIAKALRSGSLRGIYVPGKEHCDDRCLVRIRGTLTKDLTRNKNRVKSFLHFHGIEIPSGYMYSSKTWSANFVRWLESLDLGSKSSNEALRIITQECKKTREAKLDVTKKIKELSLTQSYKENTMLLRSVPGVGLITCMEFLTEVVNLERFRGIDQLTSFVGLIPSTHSSGEKEITSGITPRGQKTLRRALVESAWTAVRTDPALTHKYFSLLNRMTAQKAIVRIAKNLLARIYFVLKNKQPYKCHIVNHKNTAFV